MKRTINTIGLFTFVGLLACLLFLYEVPPHAEAGVGTFRTGIANLLSSEFTTAQSNRIGNAFADQYQGEWQAAVNANTYANTAAGRRQFAAKKITEYAGEITRAYEQRSAVNAVPTPTPLPGE